jgi:uncharacterized delta-60 repeat protein
MARRYNLTNESAAYNINTTFDVLMLPNQIGSPATYTMTTGALGTNTNYAMTPVFNPRATSTYNDLSYIGKSIFNGFSGVVGTVSCNAIQPDGKILMGGAFTSYNGKGANRIIRLNPNGTIDATFNSGIAFNDGTNIYSIVVQPDGKILVGGDFLTYQYASYSAGKISFNIIRLNSDGTIDTSFNTIYSGSNGFNSLVYKIALQSDGKILVGGMFTTYAGVSANRIVRLNSDGSRDTGFSIGTGFDGTVRAITIQSDGNILVGGDFTTYNGTSRNRIIRLTNTGANDTTLSVGTGFDNSVYDIALQTDGQIVIGGSFNQYKTAGNLASKIIRISSTGTEDLTFSHPSYSTGIFSLAIQADGKILLGSDRVYRLLSTGATDTAFNSNSSANDIVYAIALQSDGKIVIGGVFTVVNTISTNCVARLNTNGTFDTQFDTGISGFDNVVNRVFKQSDGKIIVAGYFSKYELTNTSQYIIRLNANGTTDTSFSAGTGVENPIYAIRQQSDGKIILGGAFATYNSTTVNRIVRLNTDGSRDTSFVTGTGFNGSTYSLAIQSDGKIIVGGAFTTYNGSSAPYIVRLNTDGSIDSTFATGTGFNSSVNSVLVQPDGNVLVGGEFTTYQGTTRNRIIRLTSSGAFDSSFAIGTGFGIPVGSSGVENMELQSDGKVLAVGGFNTYQGTSRNYITRINSNGTLDTTFVVGTGLDNYAYTIRAQSTGKVLVGGVFTTYNGTTVSNFIKLNSNGSIDTSYNNKDLFNSYVNNIHVNSDDTFFLGGAFTKYLDDPCCFLCLLNSDGYRYDTLYRGLNSSTAPTSCTSSINVSTANSSYFLKKTIYRIDVFGNQIGTIVSPETQLSTTGAKTFSFDVRSLGKFNNGDRIVVKYEFRNSAMNSQNLVVDIFSPNSYLSGLFPNRVAVV